MYVHTKPAVKATKLEDGKQQLVEPAVLSARGRIGRLQLIAYTPTILIFYTSLATLVLTEMFGSRVFQISLAIVVSPLLEFFLSPAGLVLAIGLFIYNFMKIVQRSHDIGWSGWAALLTLLPLTVLIWYFVPGNRLANAYGSPARKGLAVRVFSFSLMGLMLLCIGVGILLINAPVLTDFLENNLRIFFGIQ